MSAKDLLSDSVVAEGTHLKALESSEQILRAHCD